MTILPLLLAVVVVVVVPVGGHVAGPVLVVGGTSTILLEHQRRSPVLEAVELVGCPGGPVELPPYPE